MRRVMIFGSVGTGKTTLATALGPILGLPVIHLDTLVWQPGCRTIPDEEFSVAHDELLSRKAWIIEGVGPWQTWAARVAAADTIILPEYHLWQNWRWLAKRQWDTALGRRPATPPDCPLGPMTLKLFRWTWVYRREMGPALLRIIAREGEARRTVLRFRTPAATSRFLAELRRG